jgi:hypothetical protein
MSIRILLIGMLLTMSISAGANEQIYLRFELAKGEKAIERVTPGE